MSLYRKRPITVVASQWFKDGDHPDVEILVAGDEHGYINTLEGGHIVMPGDWIITGVEGEVYPCKPSIFAATYDEVSK